MKTFPASFGRLLYTFFHSDPFAIHSELRNNAVSCCSAKHKIMQIQDKTLSSGQIKHHNWEECLLSDLESGMVSGDNLIITETANIQGVSSIKFSTV